MPSLEEYLRGPFREDLAEIRRVGDLLQEVLPVFPKFYVAGKGWPYEICQHQASPEQFTNTSTNFSFSTVAMISFTIAVALGGIREGVLLPRIACPATLAGKEADFKPKLDEAWGDLVTSSLGRIKKKQSLIYSKTFDENDPFTLTWLAHFVKNDVVVTPNNFTKDFNTATAELLRASLKDISKPVVPHATNHAFPVLRLSQLYITCKGPKIRGDDREKFRDYFSSKIHQHLSYAGMKEGPFDAAELAFAVEGYSLIEEPAYADRTLIERVFEVISESQTKSAYWRALRPFVAYENGAGILPLSVEMANSLLRTCARLANKSERSSQYFSRFNGMFRRYAAWLQSRVARGNARFETDKTDREFVGWHSEHVHEPRKIHTWETAQVVLFLLYYRSMLQQHVADVSLDHAGLRAKDVRDDGKTEKKAYETPDKLRAHCSKFESISSIESLRIYPTVTHDFVEPELHRMNPKFPSSNERKCSMLLYGPPGTGKSTLPEEIARALDWPLITVTPSDFIAGGESQVEARARAIFEVLEQQSNVVILFDEIDRLILDRDAKAYSDQEDIFQFMTPSMLVKLKDIRRLGRSIFVIATNYMDRLDPAAIRMGRVDAKLLIAPPDWSQRLRILKERTEKLLVEKGATSAAIKSIKRSLGAKEIGRNTVLMTFGELSFLVETAAQTFAGLKSTDFIEKLKEQLSSSQRPSIGLGAYGSRFRSVAPNKDDFRWNQEPHYEFLTLAYLKAEVGAKIEQEEIDVIHRALKMSGKSDIAKAKEELAKRHLDKAVQDKLLSYFVEKGVIDDSPSH